MALFLEVQIPFLAGTSLSAPRIVTPPSPSWHKISLFAHWRPFCSGCCDWSSRGSEMVVNQHLLAESNFSVSFSQLCHPCHRLTSRKFSLYHDPKRCCSSKWAMLPPVIVSGQLLGMRWLPDWVFRCLEGRLFLPLFFWTKWLLIKIFFPLFWVFTVLLAIGQSIPCPLGNFTENK